MSTAPPRQLTVRVPREPWPYLRVVTFAAMVALAVTCAVAPRTGLPVLWGLVVPALPLLWMLLPGLWRNVCPMASANQVPRWLRFTQGRPLPRWLDRHGYSIGMGLFFFVISLRPGILSTDGTAAAVMLVVALGAAFVGGILFRGKSGFCGSVCPLRP